MHFISGPSEGFLKAGIPWAFSFYFNVKLQWLMVTTAFLFVVINDQ